VVRILVLILIIGFAFLGASIGYFNAEEVEFNFLAGSVQLPLIALLVASFLCAVLLTLLICFVRMLGLRSEIRSLRKKLNSAESELRALRELPVKAEAPVGQVSSAAQLPPPV
tara:strand:+ start:3486 stop:3824 length:339 start_codon:yes stop_codon:yes gene_type:complete